MPLQTHTPRAWANAVLADGAACIVDVETSGLDGSIIEIAVIDAATGEVLLNTLVDCSPVEIEPGAVEVHGLTATDLAGAPRWSEVFPELAAATKNRVVLAYNAKFDRGRVLHDCRREGIDPAHLAGAFAPPGGAWDYRSTGGGLAGRVRAYGQWRSGRRGGYEGDGPGGCRGGVRARFLWRRSSGRRRFGHGGGRRVPGEQRWRRGVAPRRPRPAAPLPRGRGRRSRRSRHRAGLGRFGSLHRVQPSAGGHFRLPPRGPRGVGSRGRPGVGLSCRTSVGKRLRRT